MRNISILILVTLIFSTNSFAQSVGILCANTRTKVVTIEKSKCATGQVRLSLNNITGVDMATCYSTSGKNSGASNSGEVSVSLNCRTGFYVESDSFSYSDETRANPSLSAKTYTFANNSKRPTGVSFELRGTQNLFYTASAMAVCCPQ
jgi:hypothetical protein